jgi:hypothetical protein
MTLKEKFLNSPCELGYINTNEHRAENNVKIADEFAIGFATWVGRNPLVTKFNSYKELLIKYKKEKGL